MIVTRTLMNRCSVMSLKLILMALLVISIAPFMTMPLFGFKIDLPVRLRKTILYYVYPEEPSSKQVNTYSTETQEQRKTTLKQYCDRMENSKHVEYDERFLINNKHKVIYCIVPKVGCTTWKRVFLLLQGPHKTLQEIPIFQVHGQHVDLLKSLNISEIESKMKDFYSFMFARHPHARLFSAYRNKFLNPFNNTKYISFFGPWMVYGDHFRASNEMEKFLKDKNIDRAKMNVTFSQFLKYVTKHESRDPHWMKQTNICRMCNFNFKYLGKFETMNKDAEIIFKDINRTDIYNMFGDETLYTQKTTSIMKLYYGQVPKELLQKIYQIYKDDFEAFGYDPYYYINF